MKNDCFCSFHQIGMPLVLSHQRTFMFRNTGKQVAIAPMVTPDAVLQFIMFTPKYKVGFEPPRLHLLKT